MTNKSSTFRDLVVTSMFLLVIAGFAKAGTITIGPPEGHDFDTIQAGIDTAIDGDTVLVAPGEYVVSEPITFLGKAITVQSEAGPDETTIRMGTPADTNRGSVVVFENNETAASVLEGFTISGGTGCRSWISEESEFDWGGGGILFNASSGTVKNCTIVQNRARDVGGGVMIYSGSSPTLTNCNINGNSATTESGGGVCCGYDSSVTMTYCTIIENSAEQVGGGIISYSNSSVIMAYCTIVENSASQGGGGVFCGENSSSVTMTHCVVVGNTAGIGGGGLEIWHQASATMTNCVIARNTTVFGGGIICAPYGYQGCSVTVTNSIIWGNNASQGREIQVENPAIFSISYSNVRGGQTGINVESGGTLNWGKGNIDADPLFACLGLWDDKGTRDPSDDVWIPADYHLKSQAGRWDCESQTWIHDDVTSPCIDVGDPMSPIGLEPFPNGGFVNMGAFGGTSEASKTYFGEPICRTIVAGDINGDCQVDQADLEIMALHWTDEEPLPFP